MRARCLVFVLILLGFSSAALAQDGRANPIDKTAGAHYVQLTLNLKFGASGSQPGTTQTITTEVAIRPPRTGSCKARMLSQVPTGSGSATKYIELGTKFDCNDVHMEGGAVALQFALETSRVAEMIKTKGSDGAEVDEPLITQRNVELAVKLPLNQSKVVFDSESHALNPLQRRSLKEGDAASPHSDPAPAMPARQDPAMVIEMKASEIQ